MAIKIHPHALCRMVERGATKPEIIEAIENGERFINIHSVSKLLEESSKFNKDFLKFINNGKILDRYYLTTRYPDTVAEPAIPYEVYTEKEANESIEIATTIFEISKQKIEIEPCSISVPN